MAGPSVSILGTGALGSALARALHAHGFELVSLYNRTASKAEELAGRVGDPHAGSFPGKEDPLGELVLLPVSDGAIGKIAGRLAGSGHSLEGTVIAHCSGNEPASLLSELREQGAHIAAFHPLQTFSGGSGPGDFREIYFSVQGDPEAVKTLEGVAGTLGARSFELPDTAKPYMHAAAVMASNYLVALLDAAGDIAALEGIDPSQARKALLPLARTALSNAAEQGPVQALSGPIARGDVETVEKHVEILKNEERLLSLYKQLGRLTLEMAREKGSITGKNFETLTSLLQ